jgi:hypothetical protein
MPASELDIARAAHVLIQQHGDSATAEARKRVDDIAAGVIPRAPTLGCGSSRRSARWERRRRTLAAEKMADVEEP